MRSISFWTENRLPCTSSTRSCTTAMLSSALSVAGHGSLIPLDDVPTDSLVVISAHGVSPQELATARRRRLRVIDATCPLVTRVHLEAIKAAKDGYQVVLVGHEGHDEVEGTKGVAPEATTVVDTPEDVGPLAGRREARARRHANNAVRRRHGGHGRGDPATVRGRPSPQRHLLRDDQPAGGGQDDRGACRTRDCRRLPELQQHAPARRGRPP